MKAYQIVIKGNERSEEYAEISRKSFEPALDRGILSEIITFDAITPDSDDFEEHVQKYTWEASLMHADLPIHDGKSKPDHSPTEKAGMCSHWELMRRQSLSEERFFVMEHDTYLLDVDMLEKCMECFHTYEPLYANFGAFMGFYSFDHVVAEWQYRMLTQRDFPINCGPYCTLQRLFATHTTRVLKLPTVNYRNRKYPTIHPWGQLDTLYFGNNVQIPFNEKDPDRESNPWKTPTTQVVAKHLGVTQEHHSYSDLHIEKPWLRSKFFHIID